MATNIGSLIWSTGISFDGFRRDSKKAQGALGGLFKPSILGAAAVGAALVSAGKAALDFSRDFETAFAEVRTISETARNNADEMRESILRMTTEIPVGAVDSTKALYQIVSAGFDGAEAMNVLEISAKAAVAGVTSTAIAADTLTTIINAYGMSAGDAMEISDALFKTVELGKTTLAEIGASFSQVAPLAATYGIELNQVFAAMATMTKQGAPTSEAITGIRQAIISVTEKMGENVFQGRDMIEVFDEARIAAKNSGGTMRDYFGRVQAVGAVLLTTGKNQDIYNEALKKTNDSVGSTEKALAIMNDTLEAQETLLKNNVNVLKDQFGSVLKDLWLNILPGLNNDLKTLADDSIPGYAKALATLVAAINIPAMFGGPQFTPLDFSPEIVKMRKFAEAETGAFLKNTADLSDKEFEKEVERQKQLKEIISNNVQDLNDRKEKGHQFDEDALANFQKQNLALYHILEASEERLGGIREKGAKRRLSDIEKLNLALSGGKAKTQEGAYGDIKQAIKDVQEAIDGSTKKEIGDLSIRLAALQKEKQAWEDIAEAAAKSVRDEAVPSLLPTKGAKPIDISNIKLAVLDLQKLNKSLEEGKKKAEEMADELDFEKKMKLADQFSDASAALSEVSGLVSKIDEGLGQMVDQAAQFASGAAGIVSGLATGNIFQVIGGAATAISSLVTSKEVNDTEKYEKAIRSLESAYKDLNRQVDIALGEERITSRGEAIKNIENQVKALEGLIQAEKESVKVTKFLGITIKKKSNTDFEAIEEYKEQIKDLNREIEDILMDTTELITGTTGEDLAGAFIDAFQIGENAAKEFGDVLNDVIKTSVKNALARKFLEKPLQDAINTFEKDIESGGVLTQEEADRFRNSATTIGQAYADALEQASAALGISFADGAGAAPTGISGAIRRELTEETGGILQGLWRRTLDETLKHTDIMNESNAVQERIADNTLRTAIACESLDDKISANQDNRDLGV